MPPAKAGPLDKGAGRVKGAGLFDTTGVCLTIRRRLPDRLRIEPKGSQAGEGEAQVVAQESKHEALAETSLAERAREALGWWRDELAAMVPNALRARKAGRRAAIDCVLLPDGRAAVALAEPRKGALPDPAEALASGPALVARLRALAELAPERTLRLSVPRDLCFVRRTRLPARALGHAGAILRHEAEGLMPFAPAEILSDWYVETEDTDARELNIVHVVLARPRIRALEEAIAEADLTLVRIGVGHGEGRPVPVDLLSVDDPSLLAGVAALSPFARLAGGAALLILLATPFLAIGQQEAELDALRAARAASPKPAVAALSAGAVADFLDARASRPPVALILDDLARTLPRDAVLTDLKLEGDRLTVGLQGAGAERARGALRDSALLAPAPGDAAPGQLAFTLRALDASGGEGSQP